MTFTWCSLACTAMIRLAVASGPSRSRCNIFIRGTRGTDPRSPSCPMRCLLLAAPSQHDHPVGCVLHHRVLQLAAAVDLRRQPRDAHAVRPGAVLADAQG